MRYSLSLLAKDARDRGLNIYFDDGLKPFIVTQPERIVGKVEQTVVYEGTMEEAFKYIHSNDRMYW